MNAKTGTWFTISVVAWAFVALPAIGFGGFLVERGTAPDMLSGFVAGAFFASVGWLTVIMWLGESIEEAV